MRHLPRVPASTSPVGNRSSSSVPIPGFVVGTRNVPTIPPGRPWAPRTRKTRDPTPPAGPPPATTSSVIQRVPPSPAEGRLRRHDPCPIRSVPEMDRWCLQLLTSMQRDCDTVNPPRGDALGTRGMLRAGRGADHGTTPVLEHSEPKTQHPPSRTKPTNALPFLRTCLAGSAAWFLPTTVTASWDHRGTHAGAAVCNMWPESSWRRSDSSQQSHRRGVDLAEGVRN